MTTAQDKDTPDLLVEAMALVAEQGWRRFRAADLAARAGVSMARIYEEFPTRQRLVKALGRRLDRAMLGMDSSELAELSIRERLFELMMRRLEAMTPFREGLQRLSREAACDPAALLTGACNLDRTTRWLIDAAGVEPGPGAGPLGRKALAFAYLRSFNAWLRDDTPDRAKTMAELDRGLQRLERLAGMRRPFRRARPSAAGAST